MPTILYIIQSIFIAETGMATTEVISTIMSDSMYVFALAQTSHMAKKRFL